MRNLSALTKTRVTTTRVANAFTGYATGILIAGDIECIVITATREHAQAFMDRNNTVPGDAKFSAPVAMVQLKDVEDHGPAS